MADYEPVRDPCRVCGNPAPHELRGEQPECLRVLVLCKKCRTLLEYVPFKRLGELLARKWRVA